MERKEGRKEGRKEERKKERSSRPDYLMNISHEV
jgi:hypothetical protein